MILFYYKNSGEIFAKVNGFENNEIDVHGENIGKFIIEKNDINGDIAKIIEHPEIEIDIENYKIDLKINKLIKK